MSEAKNDCEILAFCSTFVVVYYIKLNIYRQTGVALAAGESWSPGMVS